MGDLLGYWTKPDGIGAASAEEPTREAIGLMAVRSIGSVCIFLKPVHFGGKCPRNTPGH